MTNQQKQFVNQDTLMNFLSLVRPHGLQGEQMMIDQIINLTHQMGYVAKFDEFGNIIVNALPSSALKTLSRVMFTSHTDSVHKPAQKGETPVYQQLAWVDKTTVCLSSQQDTEYQPDCLGADCATGVYIMLRLLQAGVPALYCFFRQEETGRQGSTYYVQNESNQELLDSLTHCISFDRKGTSSIITKQKDNVCASDEFAQWLGKTAQAIDPTLKLEKDPTGRYTDSASFMDVISECTNISVGYCDQHTSRETQDMAFVEQLCQAFEKIDWLNAPSYRDFGFDTVWSDDDQY